MSNSRVRVFGSGFTVMTWQGTRLAYLRTISDRSPQPVARAEDIQPIDEPVPIEVVTAQAVGSGLLTLAFFELWNAPAWQQLPGFEGTNNLLDVLKKQLSMGEVTCRKIIKNPNGAYRTRVYQGCVITDVNEGEDVNIGTITLPKSIQIAYTHTTVV
jgi:hypothetical protein